MKLLYCERCGDLFQPGSSAMRSCECGRINGRYLNDREVEVSPAAISIALDNKSLLRAIDSMRELQQRTNNTATRNEYSYAAKLRAWVRPNCGPGNPHSRLLDTPQNHSRQFRRPTEFIGDERQEAKALHPVSSGSRTPTP